MAVPNVCTFNKYGHCKYKEICTKQHENEKCEKVVQLSVCFVAYGKERYY